MTLPGALSEVSLERDLDVALSIDGWMSRDEARTLWKLAADTANGQVIVEVGSYRGRSTVALALGARRGACRTVLAVDPHAEFTGARGGRFGPADRAALYANLARAGVGEIVRTIGLPSVRAAAGWEGRDVGLLLLDGDHRYEAVAADIAAWTPHLAEGAVVAFDDCDFGDVARLCRELESRGLLAPLGAVGKLRWFRALA